MQDTQGILEEQAMCLGLHRSKKSIGEIAEMTGLSRYAVRRRIQGAEKRERLGQELAAKLEGRGIVELQGLHSGWLLDKDENGSGSSLYFHLGPDEQRISFADAILEVLADIPRLPPIDRIQENSDEEIEQLANWVALADLHVGGDYGDPVLEADFAQAIDHLVSRLPKATHAVLMELGDLMEMNDHKGVTPGSGNHLEVKIGPAEFLRGVKTAIRLLRMLLIRLLETHDTVEVHFIRGNHDETAHIAVLMALAAQFENNPRIRIFIPESSEEFDFRVVTWGKNGVLLNHGDKAKWPDLKDIFADQFPNEWAASTSWRAIFTAHFHHDRKRDLIGCTAEHFQTLHRPNQWAKSKALLSRGSIKAITVHGERGEEHRTISNIRNTIMGRER